MGTMRQKEQAGETCLFFILIIKIGGLVRRHKQDNLLYDLCPPNLLKNYYKYTIVMLLASVGYYARHVKPVVCIQNSMDEIFMCSLAVAGWGNLPIVFQGEICINIV